MNWIEIIFSGLLVLFAGVTTYYVINQGRIEKTKLKIDLYPKRLQVYDSMQRLISTIEITGTCEYSELITMLQETKHAKFLFDEKDCIVEYINEFYKKGIEIKYKDMAIEKEWSSTKKERLETIEITFELKKWFRNQRKVIDQKFKKYIKI